MICFATNNENKIKEINELLINQIKIIGLKDIGCTEELPETGNTIEQNSLQKAKYVHEKYKINCFADDSGLEINALNGQPGVDSAHFCGKRDDQQNMAKVLHLLEKLSNRKANFKTVITLAYNNVYTQFEGIIEGEITLAPIGNNGFGYDPIFKPVGFDSTFAQMTGTEKSEISHRALAVKQLIEHLNRVID